MYLYWYMYVYVCTCIHTCTYICIHMHLSQAKKREKINRLSERGRVTCCAVQARRSFVPAYANLRAGSCVMRHSSDIAPIVSRFSLKRVKRTNLYLGSTRSDGLSVLLRTQEKIPSDHIRIQIHTHKHTCTWDRLSLMTCPCFYKHANPHLSPLHTKQTQIMRPTYMSTHAHSCTRTHPPTHARTHPTSLTYTHTYTAGICWGDQQRLEHATHTPHTHPHTHPHPSTLTNTYTVFTPRQFVGELCNASHTLTHAYIPTIPPTHPHTHINASAHTAGVCWGAQQSLHAAPRGLAAHPPATVLSCHEDGICAQPLWARRPPCSTFSIVSSLLNSLWGGFG